MSELPGNTGEERPAERRPRWPLVVGIVFGMLLLFGLGAVVVVFTGFRQAARIVEGTGEQISDIAEKFRSGTITTTFLASLPETESTGFGNLELATTKVTETFTRSEERRIFWDKFSLGETTSEIRVPVTYRYHVSLGDEWRLEVSGQTCLVHAPEIRASLPPAIHVDQMERKTQSSTWFAVDGNEQLDELQRSLGPLIESYAQDATHVNAARETARETVANFVRAWLLREDHWREDRFRSIVVRFADEGDAPRLSPPTLALEITE